MQKAPKNKAIFRTEQMKGGAAVQSLYETMERPGEVNPLDVAFAVGVLKRDDGNSLQDAPELANRVADDPWSQPLDLRGMPRLAAMMDQMGLTTDKERHAFYIASLLLVKIQTEREIEASAARRAAM